MFSAGEAGRQGGEAMQVEPEAKEETVFIQWAFLVSLGLLQMVLLAGGGKLAYVS
jgi:hypothetical protein